MDTRASTTETKATEHEHYTKTREGAMVWSTKDECVICGTGTDWR